MTKSKTIPCDKCGARLENIPGKCPHCGEEIAGRMEVHVRKKVKWHMISGKPHLMIEKVYLGIMLFLFIIMISMIIMFLASAFF